MGRKMICDNFVTKYKASMYMVLFTFYMCTAFLLLSQIDTIFTGGKKRFHNLAHWRSISNNTYKNTVAIWYGN